MGEIKSTLDLVLEKTRNLTLSEEEKRDLARDELDKKIRGIACKYLDNLLPSNRIREELESIETNQPGLPYKLFTKHLLARVDLDADISAILSALKEVVGFDRAALDALQKEYKAEKKRPEGLSRRRPSQSSNRRVFPVLPWCPTWMGFRSG